MEWHEQARKLTLGQKRKIPHCSTDASAYINNNAKGVSLHCFRCGANEFEPHGRLSASELLAMRAVDEEEAERPYPDVCELYADSVPSAAHVWVLKTGLTPERATDEYGIAWSPRSSRVIVPILHNGEPTGQWTGRAVDGRKPKYLMPRGSVGAYWYGLRGNRTPCVVVEDVLSAIRVYEAGYSSMAVLGTTISLGAATVLSRTSVIGWFDGDKAGRDGYVKLRKALGPFGIEPLRVVTERDPKTYSRKAITQYIKDAT